jgi:hypothetical protein
MASVTEQWAEQAEGVAAGAVTAMARLGQKLAELQAELQVRGRWIHSAHGSDSGAIPPVCLSWCPHTPAHSGRPRTAPQRGHAFSLWSGCGVFGAYPGWAGHAGGLQASRRWLSEAERAEQLRLRLRAEEEAAVAVAAAAKAATEEEEAAAPPHGSGGMGCSSSVLLAHAVLFPGHPGVLGQSAAGPQQRAWVRGWTACWMSWVRALTAVCDDGGGDEESQLLPPPRRGEATQLALRASSFLDAAAEAEALGQKQGQQRAGESGYGGGGSGGRGILYFVSYILYSVSTAWGWRWHRCSRGLRPAPSLGHLSVGVRHAQGGATLDGGSGSSGGGGGGGGGSGGRGILYFVTEYYRILFTTTRGRR